MKAAETRQHPERALVHRAIDEQLHELPVESSPMATALGMRILEASVGTVRLAYTVGAAFTQGSGVVQGGIISAMLDYGMAFAAFSIVPADASVTTISQTTNFFRPVRPGDLRVDAELDKAGRTIINSRAALRDSAGVLLGSATSALAVIRYDPPT
jgi:uncharacterized protein (TIGR00369 family)